jgi:hypothetical protein
VRRLVRIMLGLTAAGALAWSLLLGLDGLRSFAAGAAISWLSFFLLHRLIADVGTALEGGRPHPLSFLIHALRTLILGGAAYVILKVYEAHSGALVTGLLVTVSAAVVEALLEQLYAS